MKTEVLLRSIGKINDELIADAESEANTKRKPGWAKLGIMAACLALVLAVALVIPTLTRQDQSIITENEPKIELTLNEAMNDKTFGMLFPKQILEGYVLEDTPGIYGVSDYAELMKKPNSTVLEALFCNEEIGDEMRIRVASKEWFHSHEKESTETNTIHYNEHLVGVGSYIYFESGENIICYLFTTRDIAQIDGFCDMVNSASADTSSVSISKFISLEEAKKIALKDAGLDEATQKIVFTREELSRNSGKPCYILEFYTAKKQYSYKVDAKDGSIMEAYHFILLKDAKKIALEDAGVNVKVVFTTEELVAGGIKTPYYRFVFADTKTQWTYRIDAVLGTVLEKQQKEIVTTDFISLEEAKEIALKDAGLNEATQKIVFTREDLNRNSGKPCYILEFYTAKKQYSYKVDAKNGNIMEAYHFILLADAKKIALDDAGVSEKVTFTEETLVAGGIKSPYYYFAFESASARWSYKIDAVLGVIMDKTCDKIIPPAPEFIGLEKAKQIALEDAGLDETAQKIVFTREELSRNQGKPCYILEFYTDKCAYSYKIDAVSGEIIGKKTEWFSRQESETVPDTSQNSDSKQRRTD
jgi:uncharacterized membrane protein YkoI